MTIDVSAKVLLFDDFESKLDWKKWEGNKWNPKDWKTHVYTKDGLLYLNQKKSGRNYVAFSSIQKFTECPIYWEWIMIEWTGGGDCGGQMRTKQIIGALECIKMELYRRGVSEYEDKKILENGDIGFYQRLHNETGYLKKD